MSLSVVQHVMFNEIIKNSRNRKLLSQYTLTNIDDIENVEVVALFKSRKQDKITLVVNIDSIIGYYTFTFEGDSIIFEILEHLKNSYTTYCDSKGSSLTILNHHCDKFFIANGALMYEGKGNIIKVSYGVSEGALRLLKKKCIPNLYKVKDDPISTKNEKIPDTVKVCKEKETHNKILEDSDVIWSKKIDSNSRDEYGFEVRKNLGFREE